MLKETSVGLEEVVIDKNGNRNKRRFNRGIQLGMTLILIIATLFSVGAAFINIVYDPIYIDGLSMYPTLNALAQPQYKEFGFMDSRPKAKKNISRGDIIVFKQTENNYLIKRIIALPFESIKIEDNIVGDKIYIRTDSEGDVFTLPEEYLSATAHQATALGSYGVGSYYDLAEHQYFVMGDNRGNSSDSRSFGAIEFSQIEGVLKAIQGYSKQIVIQSDGKAILKNKVWYPLWSWRFYS